MAKARRRTTTSIVRYAAPRPVAPVIRLNLPRQQGIAKRKHHRRHHSVGTSGAMSGKTLIGAAIGGAILGFLEKQFPNMPTVPLVGRAGTIAVGAYFIGKRGGMGFSGVIRDVALAGAVVAGYQLGKTGKVAGDVDGDDDYSRAHGLAAEA
jgi:hypothetical protein